MGMGWLSRRALFIVPLVTAWLTSSPAGVPATHTALVPVAASAGCPVAEVVGVHGTSEGPSGTYGTDSPEIKATFAAFADDESKLGEHGARLDYFAYPTVTFAARTATSGASSTRSSSTATRAGTTRTGTTGAWPGTP